LASKTAGTSVGFPVVGLGKAAAVNRLMNTSPVSVQT
jgi:hypothetical protein